MWIKDLVVEAKNENTWYGKIAILGIIFFVILSAIGIIGGIFSILIGTIVAGY